MIERCYECGRREIRYELHRLWRKVVRFFAPPPPVKGGVVKGGVMVISTADEMHRLDPAKSTFFTQLMELPRMTRSVEWKEDEFMPRLSNTYEIRWDWPVAPIA